MEHGLRQPLSLGDLDSYAAHGHGHFRTSMKSAIQGGPLVWRLALIIGAISISHPVWADGLLLQFKTIQSGCEVSVLTSDQILAREPSQFEVLVQRPESGQLVPDAVVSVTFRPDVAYGSQTTPEFCSPVSPREDQLLQTKVEAFTVEMAPRFGAAGIYYTAPVIFPVKGMWRMKVLAHSYNSQISASGDVSVSAASGRWRLLRSFVVLPIAIISLFGANQWLRMGRLPSLA